MIGLEELKQWLKIDFEDDDATLEGLISASKAIIKSATGVAESFVSSTDSQEVKNLYLMIQRVLINDMYNMRDTENKALISLYTQLETTYKAVVSVG